MDPIFSWRSWGTRGTSYGSRSRQKFKL